MSTWTETVNRLERAGQIGIFVKPPLLRLDSPEDRLKAIERCVALSWITPEAERQLREAARR